MAFRRDFWLAKGVRSSEGQVQWSMLATLSILKTSPFPSDSMAASEMMTISLQAIGGPPSSRPRLDGSLPLPPGQSRAWPSAGAMQMPFLGAMAIPLFHSSLSHSSSPKHPSRKQFKSAQTDEYRAVGRMVCDKSQRFCESSQRELLLVSFTAISVLTGFNSHSWSWDRRSHDVQQPSLHELGWRVVEAPRTYERKARCCISHMTCEANEASRICTCTS